MKTLPLGTAAIQISSNQETYNILRLKYQDLAEKAKGEFIAQFDRHFDNMDELHEKFKQVAIQYLNKPVDIAIRDLIAIEITDIDDEYLLEKYLFPNISWDDGLNIIDDKYMEIVLNAEELNEYREACRESRPGVMGGGFGLEGAAAGIAIATAANVALGAIQGVINVGAKSLSAFGDYLQKDELYRSPHTRKHLTNFIYHLTFQVHFAFIDAVKERQPEIEFENISVETIAKSKAILKNLSMGRITAEHIEKNLVKALSMNPYEQSLYFFWLDIFGDADDKLINLAQFFGLGAFLSNYKREIFLKYKDNLDFSTSETCKLSLTNLKIYAQSIGYRDIDSDCKEITLLAARLDKEERTVDGVIFKTQKEALKVRNNKVIKPSEPGYSIVDRENRILNHLQKKLNRTPTENEIRKAKWDGLEL